MTEESKRNYVSTEDPVDFVLSMLSLSKAMSNSIPSKQEFYASLEKMNIEPTDELLTAVRKSFPTIGI